MNQAVDIPPTTTNGPTLMVGAGVGSHQQRPVHAVLDIQSGARTCVELAARQHPCRPAVEQFVASVYYQVHRANLKAFLPSLFAVRSEDAAIEAVIGVRGIDCAPVFLEQYLDSSIDRILSAMSAAPVARHNIAEVGNLASVSAGASRTLIAFMVYYLQSIGVQWAVCTGTNAVRAALKRVGVGFELIADARGERLGDELVDWGSYYHNNPFVLAVNINDAAEALKSRYQFRAGV